MIDLSNLNELSSVLEFFVWGVVFGIGIDTIVYCISIPIVFIYNLIQSA